MNDAPATFIGTGRLREFPDGGWILKLSFSERDVAQLQDNLSGGWVRIDVKKRRQPSDKGQTHYGQLDTWKPATATGRPDGPIPAPQGDRHATGQAGGLLGGDGAADDGGDNLPF